MRTLTNYRLLKSFETALKLIKNGWQIIRKKTKKSSRGSKSTERSNILVKLILNYCALKIFKHFAVIVMNILFFRRYIFRLFRTGYRRDLDVNDLYEPLKEHSSHKLGEQISALWEEECQRVKIKNNSAKNSHNKLEPSLLRVLLRLFGAKLVFLGICLVLMEILLR